MSVDNNPLLVYNALLLTANSGMSQRMKRSGNGKVNKREYNTFEILYSTVAFGEHDWYWVGSLASR